MSKEPKAKKPFYKKWWVWLLAIIVVGAIASGGGEDTPDTAGEGSTDTPKADAPAKEEAKIAGIGEVVKVGDVEFTVNSTSTAKNVGGEWGSNAQGTYLLVNVTVTNKGNEAITTDTSFFKLKAGEKTYEADSTASMHTDKDLKFFLQQVNPDISNTGTVVFDVTDEVIANPELKLQVQSGFWGTETGEIKITQ